MRVLSVYQRIMRAAKRGTGAYLTPDDVQELSMDHAISEAALDEEDKVPSTRTSAPAEGASDE